MSVRVLPPNIPRVKVAWPTIGIFLLSQIGLLASVFVALRFPFVTKQAVTAVPLMVWSTICIVFTFTPSHEASHRNVCRSRFLNDWIGRCSIFWMHGAFSHFKEAHLSHHAHANDASNDPDIHASAKPGLKAFVWWAFSLTQYTVYLLRRGKFYKSPMSLAVYVFIILLYVAAFYYGVLWSLVIAWSIPTLVGTAIVVYIFDRLPHVPHKETEKYRLARIIEVSPLVWFIMQGHNYHLIHHLWPSIPWYEYGRAFEEKRVELINAGATIDQKL